MICCEVVGKRPEVNDSFDCGSGIQPIVLLKIEIQGWILIATQIEADKKRSARQFTGIGDVNAKVVFDIWFWKCLVGGSTVGANIDCVSGN